MTKKKALVIVTVNWLPEWYDDCFSIFFENAIESHWQDDGDDIEVHVCYGNSPGADSVVVAYDDDGDVLFEKESSLNYALEDVIKYRF